MCLKQKRKLFFLSNSREKKLTKLFLRIQRVRIIRQAQINNFGEPQQRINLIKIKTSEGEKKILSALCVSKTEEEIVFLYTCEYCNTSIKLNFRIQYKYM